MHATGPNLQKESASVIGVGFKQESAVRTHVPARLLDLAGSLLRARTFGLGPDPEQPELLLLPLVLRILLDRAVEAGFASGEQTFQRLSG